MTTVRLLRFAKKRTIAAHRQVINARFRFRLRYPLWQLAFPMYLRLTFFCGAGGLSLRLKTAGIGIVAGFDNDPRCKYPFESNIGAGFFQQDVRTITKERLERLWPAQSIRLLAGCAPCQPFSKHRRGADTSSDREWPLLGSFGSLVAQTLPQLVTMENVLGIASTTVFKDFLALLLDNHYAVDYRSCYGPNYGLPQHRRRLVLLASRIGPIQVPVGDPSSVTVTVRQVIGDLPPVRHGQATLVDPLHASRTLHPINLRRIQASQPGGTWNDWPVELRAPCHNKASGRTFKSVYARMEWDQPSPTITTQAHNFGTGRFGHPEQDRAITLREAAMLQGFPRDYRFVRPSERVEFTPLGKLIGNAVPPPLGKAIGVALIERARHPESEEGLS